MITVYEAISLMITFGSLIVAVIAVVISLIKRK
ncbi:putative holin-like toxin [Heyndrickxia sporothermodurans]|uniref:Holin-like toxin n=2 Tax=Heyndrickxia TaxID=2837504 RepID=A0AB37HGC4_9BACI|nr:MULTISPECIES: putative holin-like toxin [Heyndrickxia]MBL5768812.1 putative holin-like toxin [Heyndrickxia sporothermodurans]MBL5772554.1 putative holin-like toxin [Heyndrickxia sporothermodurans]MBL5776069.1 putative holin-like toxin [Heyndrickxia sporothermodurans]MBL5779590.1 putative holin-like toxin [Heyndrickxia sporothermodurans]MBL5783171.1 putative holin-like toxin [Heyndrickxia sporothermodurans]